MLDDVDQWVVEGLDAERAQMDAVFDFKAGLADVYARADALNGDDLKGGPGCGRD